MRSMVMSLPFSMHQSQPIAIKTDLDLAAVSHSNGFSQPLFQSRLDVIQETRQVWHTQIPGIWFCVDWAGGFPMLHRRDAARRA